MKRMLALLIATLTLSAAHAAKNPDYTLYYLDKTKNVCSIEVSTTRNSPTHPHRLTSGGGYDGYSVSPDGNQVFGCKQIGVKYDEFLVFKCYLERSGRLQERIPGTVTADTDPPSADWSPHKKYLIVRVPGQVDTRTVIYSLERRKIVCSTTDLLPDFSNDQTYSFVLEDRGDDDNSPALLRVMDMGTGKMTKVAQVSFGTYGDPFQNIWFGTSHKFAFIDVKGNLCGGEVVSGKAKPVVKKWLLTNSGKCSDLRYVPGKGIYVVRKTGASSVGYYSTDLHGLTKTAILPKVKEAEPTRYDERSEGRIYSADKLLYATAESDKPGELPMVRVFDQSGKCVDVARGKSPMWDVAK